MKKNTFAAFLCMFFGIFAMLQGFAADVTVAWNPVSSPALAGYFLYYGTSSGAYGPAIDVGNKTSATVTALEAGKTYYFAVSAYDNNLTGTALSAEVSAAIPQAVPEITNLRETILTADSATIHWDTANLASDSKVEYGLTVQYGHSVVSGIFVNNHNETLPSLSANTQYHYRVRSKSSISGEAISADRTFTTLAVLDTTPPAISGVQSSHVTNSSAAISWTTNEPASSQVQYGISTAYGFTAENPALVTAHSQFLAGLQPGTTYHYRVVSKDSAGNVKSSGDLAFRTGKAKGRGR